jgi:hypothetical protein
MDEFYRNVLELGPEPTLDAGRIPAEGYAGTVAFLSDGAIQFHLAEQHLSVGARSLGSRHWQQTRMAGRHRAVGLPCWAETFPKRARSGANASIQLQCGLWSQPLPIQSLGAIRRDGYFLVSSEDIPPTRRPTVRQS